MDYKTTQDSDVFETVCEILKEYGWPFIFNGQKTQIDCMAAGGDFDFMMRFLLHTERKLFRIKAYLPFKIKEDKRVDAALAFAKLNHIAEGGSFDFNFVSGDAFFRLFSTYDDSCISKKVFKKMIGYAYRGVDEYAGSILGVSEGVTDWKDL